MDRNIHSPDEKFQSKRSNDPGPLSSKRSQGRLKNKDKQSGMPLNFLKGAGGINSYNTSTNKRTNGGSDGRAVDPTGRV